MLHCQSCHPRRYFVRLVSPVSPRLHPHSRLISSGTTNNVLWVNAHADMPLRASSQRGMSLTFLGTGSGSPGTGRGMSASLLTLHERGQSFLFDSGEGTQAALQRTAGYSASWLQRGAILVSHMHGDHCFGLPALLSGVLQVRASQEAERRSEREGREARARAQGTPQPPPPPPLPRLRVFGPPGLHRFLDAAFRSVQGGGSGSGSGSEQQQYLHQLPVDVCELLGSSEAPLPLPVGPPILPRRTLRPSAAGVYTCLQEEDLTLLAAPLRHTVPCLGYVLREAGGCNLDAGRLAAAGLLPGRDTRAAMLELKAGRPAYNVPAAGGGTLACVRPEQVAVPGGSRRGERGVAVFSDCSALTPGALAAGAGVDLLVHEATLSPGEEGKAARRGHATPVMAGAAAAALGAKALLLTHFGRAHLEQESVSSMWSLGLKEALAEGRRRGGGGAAGSGGRGRVHTRWAGVFGHVSGVFESPELAAAAAAAAAPVGEGGEGEWGSSGSGSGSGSGSAQRDFAFPLVADAPEPQAFAAAAAAAYAKQVQQQQGGGAPAAALPVMCARDFLRVIVQPAGGRRWGMCGPLAQ